MFHVKQIIYNGNIKVIKRLCEFVNSSLRFIDDETSVISDLNDIEVNTSGVIKISKTILAWQSDEDMSVVYFCYGNASIKNIIITNQDTGDVFINSYNGNWLGWREVTASE